MARERKIVKQVKNAVQYDDGTILLKEVRASYPHLDKPWAKNPDTDPAKFSLTSLAGKTTHRAAEKLIRDFIHEMLTDAKVKNGKLPSDKLFISDGDDSGKDEAEEMWIIKASENPENPPKIRTAAIEKVTRPHEIRKLIYAGCYVNVLIRPWFQNSDKWGKRVNANLLLVQYVSKGERIGGLAGIDDDEADASLEEYEDDRDYDEDGSASGGEDYEDDEDDEQEERRPTSKNKSGKRRSSSGL